MRKIGLIGLCMILMLSYAVDVNAAVSCAFRFGVCNAGENDIFHLSTQTDGHIETPGGIDFTERLCCAGVSAYVILNGTRFSVRVDMPLLILSSETNAHAELPTYNNYPVGIFLRYESEDTGLECRYGTCEADESCLFSMSSMTNAHVGNCDAFTNKMCCKEVSKPRCIVRAACLAGEFPVLGMESDWLSHVAPTDTSIYASTLCCPGLSASIGTGQVEVFGISASTNAHVQLANRTEYAIRLFLNSQVGEDISCYVKESCSAGQKCVASIPTDADSNFHLSQCNYFGNDICCYKACKPTPGQYAREYTCNDGMDNDCDGLTDGADLDCRPPCLKAQAAETSCTDRLDNDCDGDTDGDDSDCACTLKYARELSCIDGIDNDCDGLTDENGNGLLDPGEDSDCMPCPVWGACTTVSGCAGFYGLACNCIDLAGDSCPAACVDGSDCIYANIYGEDCPGKCDANTNCMDIAFDDCPTITSECLGKFCVQGDGCAGLMDQYCNCMDVDGDGCGTPGGDKCGNGRMEIDYGERCDRSDFGGIKSCKEAGFLTGHLGCSSTCQIAGCSMNACNVCMLECGAGGYCNGEGTPIKCYTDPGCTKLAGMATKIDISAKNIVTQKKVVMYKGNPVVVNIVVWENE